MVKLKTICRNDKKYKKAKPEDVQRMYRNPLPSLHPLQKVLYSLISRQENIKEQ